MVRDDERGSDDGDLPTIPVADLSDERDERPVAPRVRGPRSRRVATALLTVAVVLGAAVVATRVSGDRDRTGRPKPGVAARNVDDRRARVDVFSALEVTTASGSFHIRYRLSETPAPASSTSAPSQSCERAPVGPGLPPDISGSYGCAYGMGTPHDVTISGDGVVTVSPTAMVTHANVPGLGLITTRVNGTDVWEEGGGNYGMIPGSGTGAGAPLSQFAPLVLGTLGQREGAIAMANMASPTGYLDLAEQSITATSSLGDSEVDGVPTHDYKVTIDSNRDDRPGLTPEQAKTAAAARAILEREGYTATVVVISIDGLGFIRRAQTTVSFSDGGTVDADTTFSDIGCSTAVVGPSGPEIAAAPGGCASPLAPTTTTVVTAPTVTVPTTEPPGTATTATTAAPSPDTVASATTAPAVPPATTAPHLTATEPGLTTP